MKKIKRIGGGILFGASVFLLVLLLGEHHLQIPSWLKVAGRMHPLFLHFPIVLLLISFIIFWLPVDEKEENEWLTLLRLCAALSATITAIMGLLLSLENEKNGPVLQWHKWGGVSIAFAGTLFYAAYPFWARQRPLTKLYTTVAAIMILLTSHWGGSLTHGDNYLLAPMEQRKQVPLPQAAAFEDVIRPILEKRCYSCHGGRITKGGLSMQTMAALLKGGKTGPSFLAGFPDTSLLIQRIHLPMEEKNHMPPAARPQLTGEEKALLYAWIQSGAPDSQKVVQLPLQDTFRLLAVAALSGAEDEAADEPVYDFPAADEKKIASLNNNYRVIEPQGIHSPALSVHFYGKNMFTGKALEELLPLKTQIIELSMARMPVKDDQLKPLQEMINLQTLNLNYTDISDAGLQYLTRLKKLKDLDLSGTSITAAGLEKILELPELASVVIWNTGLDSLSVADLSRRHKKITLERGFVDNGQFIVSLSQPIVHSGSDVFDTAVHVEMSHPFKGVALRYTLDGSPPDSLKSALYQNPIDIDQTSTLVVRAFRKGWEGSSPIKLLFVRRGLVPDSIELFSKPDLNKFNGSAGTLLSDKNLGDLSFNDRQWLAYYKNDTFYLHFDNRVSVHSILLNMMENTSDNVFPPTSIEVWGGMDKKHLTMLGKKIPELPKKDSFQLRLMERITFAPTRLKCIKIIARPVAKNYIKSIVLVDANAEKKDKSKEKQVAKLPKDPKKKPVKPDPGWLAISEVVIN
jgi:uncharacterized membrane protein